MANHKQNCVEIKPSRLPSLDGWRAFSISIVLLSHFEYANGFPVEFKKFFYIFDGNLGVRVFFIISGFIITYMISNSLSSSVFSYKNFVFNRAMRILPVYCSFLLVAFFLQIIGLAKEELSSWLGCLFFCRNFLGKGNSLTIHFWSLSIEEQFYFIFPIILLFLNRYFISVAFVLVLFVSIFLRIFEIAGDYSFFGRLMGGRSSLLYGDSISVGCLLGWLYHKVGEPNKFGFVNCVCVVLAIIFFFRVLFQHYFFVYSNLNSLLDSVVVGGMIYFSISKKSIFYYFLNLPFIKFVGLLSYSLYVWHFLFLSDLHGFYIPFLSNWLIFLFPSFALGYLSWRFIELKIMVFKRKW